MPNNNYCILDFETGGLDCRSHAITQIAFIGVKGTDLTEICRYESYIRPYLEKYDEEALRITGLSLELLESRGKDINIVCNEACEKLELLKEGNKKPILCGHNIPFDIGFMIKMFRLCRKELSKYVDGEKDFYNNFHPFYLDTYKHFAKPLWVEDPSMNRFNLESCIQKAGLTINGAHNAMNDVEATRELVIYFFNKLRGGNNINENKGQNIRVRNDFHFQF